MFADYFNLLFLTVPRVGEPSSSSCPLDQDDEEHEQALGTRTLASLNQARSYPKSNPSFYRSHLPNQAYPSVPPEQAMYHMWHRVQATQPAPSFPMVPTMGNTRFQPPAAMLSMYSSPRGQLATPACQDALGLLPCFPEGAPALPRYFSPYPVSYVPRSPVPATVHKNHPKMGKKTVLVVVLPLRKKLLLLSVSQAQPHIHHRQSWIWMKKK
jgi:hypothetical protein